MSIITSSGESIELDITDPEIVTHIEDEKSCAKIIMRQINTERIYDKFLKDIGGYHNLRSENFYNYWSQDMSEELIIRASQNIEKFIKSKNSRFLSDKYMNT